jgi:hypothetical protein
MIDEESCWISIHDAVALMETMLQCYRGMAVDLLRQAVMDLKVKSKTVNSSPRYLVSDMAGTEVIHSDGGQRIEVCRKDVVEFCLKFQHAAKRSRKGKSTLSNSIATAIAEIWAGKEITDGASARNDKINEWLVSHKIIKVQSRDVTRTIQRVLRELHTGHR